MARRVEVAIVGDANSLERALNRAGKAGIGLGKVLKLGAAAGGAALVGLGVAAFNAANTHDKAIKMIGTGTGATGKDLDALEKTYSRVFSNLPVASEDAANAIADFNTRTGATGKELEDLAVSGLNLTKLLGGDVQGNIKQVTRAMGDWGVQVEDGTGFMDKLFIASQSTGIGVDTLAGQLVQFGSPLRQMGFDLDTSIALFGKFEKEGVNAELVMGSLRIALGKMAKEGVKDSSEALEILVDQIKNAGSTGEANKLALETFGSRAGPDMAAAIREGRFEIDDLTEALGNAKGAIDANAEAALTVGDRWTIVKNRVSEALVPLGEKLIAALGSVLDWLEANWPTIQQVIETVFAAIQEAWVAVGQPALEAARAGFEFVVAWVRDNWDEIRKVIRLVLDRVKLVVSGFIEIVQGIWEEWGSEILAIAKSMFNQIQAQIKAAMKVIQGVIDLVMGIISGDWGRAWDGIRGIVVGVLDNIKAIIKGTFERFFIIFKALGEKLLEGLKAGVSALGTLIKEKVIDPIVDKITGAFETVKSKAVTFGGKIVSGLIEGLKGVGQAIVDFIKTPINAVLGLIDLIKIPSFTVSIPGKSLPGPIPDIPGFSFSTPAIDPIPSIPRLARGGTATSSGLALVGEKGPELLNLGRGASVIPLSGGGMFRDLNVFVSGAAADDPSALAAMLGWKLRTGV